MRLVRSNKEDFNSVREILYTGYFEWREDESFLFRKVHVNQDLESKLEKGKMYLN